MEGLSSSKSSSPNSSQFPLKKEDLLRDEGIKKQFHAISLILSAEADYYSTYPFAQQIIGGATVLFSVCKLIIDVVTRIFYNIQFYVSNNPPKIKAFEENTKDLNGDIGFLKLGIFRMIPIEGTSLSISRLKKDFEEISNEMETIETFIEKIKAENVDELDDQKKIMHNQTLKTFASHLDRLTFIQGRINSRLSMLHKQGYSI